MSTTHKETQSKPSEAQRQLVVLTKLAYGFYETAEKSKEAEKARVTEALNHAVKHNISKKDVIAAFVEAGYSHKRAAVYAGKIDMVQRDPQAREGIVKGEINFAEASKTARENKKTSDPDKSSDMLRGYINNAAKWAVKTKLPKEDFLNRCTIAYDKADVLY